MEANQVIFGFKDVVVIISLVVAAVSSFFALKYKTKKTEETSESNASSFNTFKEYVYRELKDIDTQLKKMNENLHEMLAKDEAEEKYVTKKEHDLIMKNIDLQLKTIVEKLDQFGKEK